MDAGLIPAANVLLSLYTFARRSRSALSDEEITCQDRTLSSVNTKTFPLEGLALQSRSARRQENCLLLEARRRSVGCRDSLNMAYEKLEETSKGVSTKAPPAATCGLQESLSSAARRLRMICCVAQPSPPNCTCMFHRTRAVIICQLHKKRRCKLVAF